MNDTLDALLAILPLDCLPRTGWIQAGVPAPESLAGHIVGVAHLALALAPRVDPPVDIGKVTAMCLVHDTPEALTGDMPRSASRLLPPGVKTALEDAAGAALLGPLHPSVLDTFRDYCAQDSREARLAKLCDRLQLGVRLLGYLRAGQRGLDDFIETVAATDTSEFAPAQEFKAVLMGALRNQ
jgi:putative hydrolase of HD superfamily